MVKKKKKERITFESLLNILVQFFILVNKKPTSNRSFNKDVVRLINNWLAFSWQNLIRSINGAVHIVENRLFSESWGRAGDGFILLVLYMYRAADRCRLSWRGPLMRSAPMVVNMTTQAVGRAIFFRAPRPPSPSPSSRLKPSAPAWPDRVPAFHWESVSSHRTERTSRAPECSRRRRPSCSALEQRRARVRTQKRAGPRTKDSASWSWSLLPDERSTVRTTMSRPIIIYFPHDS